MVPFLGHPVYNNVDERVSRTASYIVCYVICYHSYMPTHEMKFFALSYSVFTLIIYWTKVTKRNSVSYPCTKYLCCSVVIN